MLHPCEKDVILHPYHPVTATSLQRPLSLVPKVAVLERFDCITILAKKIAIKNILMSNLDKMCPRNAVGVIYGLSVNTCSKSEILNEK